MKFSTEKSGSIDPAKDLDLPGAELALQRVVQRRARSFAGAMTQGLHDAADYAAETKAANDAVTKSFSSAHKDAGHVQFVAHDGPHSQVGDRVLTESVVEVDDEPTPSGSDPEVVARAFEFGSVAMDTPATAFTMKVEAEQDQAARHDLEEVAEGIE